MNKRLTLIFMISLLFALLLSAAIPKIFVVYSYDKEYAWNEALAKSIQKTLETTECETKCYYMDTRLHNDAQWKAKSGQIAIEAMKVFEPDVIIACDDNAQEYFVSLISKEDNTPIVFCGVNNDPSDYGYPNEKTTGILERPFPLRSLNMYKQIDPEIKTVAFIGDNTNSTQGYIEYLKNQDLGEFQSVGFFKYEHIEKLIKDIKTLEKTTDVFYLIRTTEFIDAEGKILNTAKVMEMINEATDKPIIGLSDYIIYDGALCGIVPNPDFHGTLSAQMALQIASGKKQPSDFPLISFRSTFNAMEDGMSIINLNTAFKKDKLIPVELANKTDVLISSLDRMDQIALDYYQYLSGQIFVDLKSFLDKLALKMHAQNQDWPSIKKDFEERLKTIQGEGKAYKYPGIYLYIKPDGSYYSHIRNLTGENLSNRPYFQMLENGKAVNGYPVISRSTGKKSCVFAVPVVKNGKSTGYVGMSLYMQELNVYLNKKMNLNDNTVYFALNSAVITLSSDESYLFLPIEAYINETEDSFLSKINSSDSGTVVFSHDTGIYMGIFDTQEDIGWKYVYARKLYDFSQNSSSLDMRRNLSTTMEGLTKKINEMEANLLEASSLFAKTQDLPEDVRGILTRLYDKSPYVYDIAYVNTALVMEYMAPDEYVQFEGSDISDQGHMQKLARTKKPVVSELLMTKEDFFGIDVEWPVFNDKGAWRGSLSMLVEPYEFFGEIIKKNLKNTDYEIWIMQPDGTIIYDIDREEINGNLFKEGIYSGYGELQTLGKEISNEKEGRGNYTFLETGSETPISKEAFWMTLNFHDNIWKVVITRMLK